MMSITEAQQQLAEIDKRRNGRLKGRDLRNEPEVVTGAHEAAEGQRAVMDAESARKAYSGMGIADGPAHPMQPSGRLEPGQYDRGYLEDSGHAAPSPQSQGPTANPMPGMAHVVLPNQPMAAAIPPQVIASFTMGSPSDR